MKKDDAIRYFGSQAKLGAALGVSQTTVSDWPDILPPYRQLQLQKLTQGALQAAPDALDVKPRQRVA
jgi:DNA-binding transcriptional regulator YdaS (Cro superfamily)